MLCCGLILIAQIDSTFKNREEYLNFDLNRHLIMHKTQIVNTLSSVSRNTVTSSISVLSTNLLLKNLSLNTSDDPVSKKSNKQVASSEMNMVTDTNTMIITTTTDSVRVEEIKNLYDSDMILGQGVKLQWIRNRMMS